MASGKLLILLGEECKRQTAYTKLDKEYEIEILLGVGSDTGDVLGLVEAAPRLPVVRTTQLKKALKKEEGAQVHAYPVFSSKTVGGKPLFLHALEAGLDTITIPTHTEHLYQIRYRDFYELKANQLFDRVDLLLQKVPHSMASSKKLGRDFRIEEVKLCWGAVALAGVKSFWVIRLRVVCGSGTYMRSLSERIGANLGTSALALSIHRTRIGKYLPLGPFGFWYKSY
ncbi:MAG: ine55 [Parcubacteria group bacterium]|nr:ine55 [Parcubacteria group bacterium]